MLIRLHRARQRLAEIEEPSPPLSLIAQDASLSLGHFIRRFTAVFGETPHQFRTRIRLERAKELLALSEDSVTDICMSVGFSSLGSFSWLFSRHFGEPPSDCRQRLYPSIALPGHGQSHITPGCMSLMVGAWARSQFSRSTSVKDQLG
ncbi:helix-turn-helix domain-containing protein [Marinobacter lacisalsi]|uniref:Helix-turn-helix domain-containing protein n=1 Tax=Marinobacter lacisalsi TaxID=475979 RepID=A0ABV8QCK4_9GAMM